MNQLASLPPLYLAIAVGALAAAVLALVWWWYRGRSAPTASVDEPIGAAVDDATSLDGHLMDIVDVVAAPKEESAAADLAPIAATTRASFAPPAVDPPASAKVRFYLHLPTQGQARSAGQIARREGYVADVQPPAPGGTHWQCFLIREMIPSAEGIEEERVYLEELANGFGGSLDRWETDARR